MNDQARKFDKLARRISIISLSTPSDLVNPILPQLMDWDSQSWQISKAKVLANIRSPQLKADFQDLFGYWEKECPDVSGISVALAIRSSLITQAEAQQTQIDLVWTGPESNVIPFRRTDQALLELINAAKRKLLIVSFAVYKIQPVIDALEQALRQGVDIKIILENREESKGKVVFAGERAFGRDILAFAKLYGWPLEKRLLAEDAKHGSLHAKVAVADSEILFISSANLTEYAMSLNMEMGILIKGGELPGQVDKHFEELITLGFLERLHP